MLIMQGDLVTLEPLDIRKHAKDYFAVMQDENIHKFTGNTVPKTIADVELLLAKYEDYFLNWMIICNDTQKVIGILRLGKPGRHNGLLVAGESEFLMSRYWRQGYMKDAKRLFYAYVFDELCVDMLLADVWQGNINSMKSLEYYGYKLAETRKEIFSKTGLLTNKYIYSLSRKDYISR